MTLLLGAIACALTFLLAGFTVELARASSDKGRAQIAADAAALAAVAESGPYGGGEHRRQAAAFAAANGASLLECLCEPAATAVQVKVEVEGVVARARAVFDASALMPAATTFDPTGLHPLLAVSVDQLVRASRGRIRVVSGRRTRAAQAMLWADALARYGTPEVADDWVAPPGSSMHEKGLAVDLGGDLDLAAELVAHLGLPLHRPLANEPWHFELSARPLRMTRMTDGKG